MILNSHSPGSQNTMNDAKRVLIVDDDESIRKSLARILRVNAFQTAEAHDGPSALIEIQRQKPDLVILDIRMPGIDGIETFKRIRDKLPSVPAIFMSAYTSSDRAQAASDAGGLSVLNKPFEIDSMLELAKSAVHTAPILIVDDHDDALSSLSRALEQANIASTTTNSLNAATQEIRRRPDRIVVADVFLKNGHGFDLLAEYSTTSDDPPVILVTGFGDRLDDTLTQNGIDPTQLQCLPKPIDIGTLVDTIAKLRGAPGSL